MAALNGKGTGGNSLDAISAFLVMLVLVPSSGNGQSISELHTRADQFHIEAQSFYRLNNDDMKLIWEAYCGELDPENKEEMEFAANIGQQLQNKEKGLLDQLLKGDGGLPDLVDAAKKLLQDADTKEEAQDILESLKKEESNLQNLYDGVVLKGSNHPFVQY